MNISTPPLDSQLRFEHMAFATAVTPPSIYLAIYLASYTAESLEGELRSVSGEDTF